MYRKGIILLLVLLLAGCWDERLYKDLSVVSLIGVGGSIGEIKGYYAYPKVTANGNELMIIEATGLSPRDVRNKADLKVEQTIDLSELSTILISDETAKSPLYDILDIYFRNPQNPVSIKMALTEGDVKPYIQITSQLAESAGGGGYYERFFESSELSTIFPKYDLQTIGSIFFNNTMDVAIPYIEMNEEEKVPVASGVALFSGQIFTGKVLNTKQSLIMLLLMNQESQHARFTYMWKNNDKDYPITADVIHVKRKWTINEELKKVTMDYEIKIAIDEFAHDRLDKKDVFNDLQAMITKKLQSDFEEVLHILQEQKSDTLGIGQYVQAFHPHLYEKDWREQFSTLTLEPKVKVNIIRTGILK